MIEMAQSILVLTTVAQKFIHAAEVERDKILKEQSYDALDPYERQQEDMRQVNRIGLR